MKKINDVFKKHFDTTYYKLIKLWHQKGTGADGYAIARDNTEGIIIEFSITKTGNIYRASSKGGLLCNPITLNRWIKFMEEMEDDESEED